ncbi:hypothetical protein BS78_K338900 [Paspalum vaginatum]|uniref:Uncharacterized protein n=1 Tax=Paspalum vaginatum TaxID=158149 RepID=A0A9W7XDP6_9POAL|nr:hypothetical protein BS78_K338900 [Paspalum vaginatum]
MRAFVCQVFGIEYSRHVRGRCACACASAGTRMTFKYLPIVAACGDELQRSIYQVSNPKGRQPGALLCHEAHYLLRTTSTLPVLKRCRKLPLVPDAIE